MHYRFAILSFTSVASLAAAAPTRRDCPNGKAFYLCASTGFNGCCSQNACALGYCPDTPTTTPCESSTTPAVTTYTSTSTTEPPYTPTPTPTYPPTTTCASGAGYYQVCANGFRGCCAADACSLPAPGYCPSAAPALYDSPYPYPEEQNGASTTATAPESVETVAARAADTCAPGTGYFQVCGNGFRGCCAGDACGLGYCPGAKPPVKEGEKETGKDTKDAGKTLPAGQCATGTGYYQVCGNGFKGCCKADACGLGFCPA